MSYIPYQSKATEMYERHKDAIQDKLENVVDHIEKMGNLMNQIDNERLVDELNYHIAKVLENIEEI